jgi:hypothetical protein
MTPVRRTAALVAASLIALGTVVVPSPAPAVAPMAAPVATKAAAVAVTKSKAMTRETIAEDGTVTQVDERNVSLKVSQTTNLRGRQEIGVSWSGAHPTGGLVGDLNSAAGVNQEYPFVLLQCRGIDSSSVPVAKRLRPETCWTQTWAERFSGTNNTAYPAWRSDAFATTAERAALVNGADPRPTLCSRPARAERWLPLVAASGAVYAGGTVGCAGMAPESSNVGGTGIPSNATYGITGTDGRGSTQFAVWTSEENATLGCSSSVPCSLVAVPVMGISCDAYGTKLPADDRPDAESAAEAAGICGAEDKFQPGQIATSGDAPNPATAGALWWAGSNWHNRIAVPLSFAQSPNVCSVVSKTKPVGIYGSVMMTELTAQWQPKFCTDKALKPFIHVQTADTSARTLLEAGNVDAAFSSRAPDGGFLRPTVQAPVAVTGFAISYVIDDADGRRYTKLRLSPRLLAKLLTESYPGNALIKNNYSALEDNPVNITKDPEFQALNPGLPEYVNSEAASTLLTLSSEADLVYALTSYLNADPEARAWLDGTPDPWGMKVNPTYKGIDLPVFSWPLNDDTLAPQSYIDSGNNPCYTYSPTPYLALIANPTAFISTIVLNMQYSISNVNTACPNGDPRDVSSLRLQIQGRQQPGFRFVLGVVPLSSIGRYGLTSAALKTGSDASPAYVSGDDGGLRAAAKLFKADPTAKTWAVDYDALRTTAGKSAYPGTIPVFADVPTTGLDKGTAARMAQFLRFAAGPGQVRGLANGQLPAGYLPLTKANGLAAYAQYTTRAAAAVAAQKGFIPALDPADDPRPPTAPTTPDAVVPPGDLPGVPGDGATPGGVEKPAEAGEVIQLLNSKTPGEHSTLGGYGLLVLLVLAAVLGVVGIGLRFGSELEAAAGPAIRSSLKKVRR